VKSRTRTSTARSSETNTFPVAQLDSLVIQELVMFLFKLRNPSGKANKTNMSFVISDQQQY